MPDYRLDRPTINGRPTLVWYIVWTEGRRSRRFSTKTTDKVEARSVLARFVAQENAPPERFTVTDLADAYLKTKEADPTIAYPAAIRNSLKHVKAGMGALPPSMVSRATIRGYVASRRKDGVKDSTITKDALLSE